LREIQKGKLIDAIKNDIFDDKGLRDIEVKVRAIDMDNWPLIERLFNRWVPRISHCLYSSTFGYEVGVFSNCLLRCQVIAEDGLYNEVDIIRLGVEELHALLTAEIVVLKWWSR
jgi:hypothetical protein